MATFKLKVKGLKIINVNSISSSDVKQFNKINLTGRLPGRDAASASERNYFSIAVDLNQT